MVHCLERDELVLTLLNVHDEEQRGVAARATAGERGGAGRVTRLPRQQASGAAGAVARRAPEACAASLMRAGREAAFAEPVHAGRAVAAIARRGRDERRRAQERAPTRGLHRGRGAHRLYTTFPSLYSRKLHSLLGRVRIMLHTSRTIRVSSFREYGWYHLDSRTLPCRLMSSTNRTCARGGEAAGGCGGKAGRTHHRAKL